MNRPQQQRAPPICRLVLEDGCVLQGAPSASRASPKSSAACRPVISHPSLPLPVLRQTDCCTSASHRFQCRLTPLNHPSTPKKNAPSKGDARARARYLTEFSAISRRYLHRSPWPPLRPQELSADVWHSANPKLSLQAPHRQNDVCGRPLLPYRCMYAGRLTVMKLQA